MPWQKHCPISLLANFSFKNTKGIPILKGQKGVGG